MQLIQLKILPVIKPGLPDKPVRPVQPVNGQSVTVRGWNQWHIQKSCRVRLRSQTPSV